MATLQDNHNTFPWVCDWIALMTPGLQAWRICDVVALKYKSPFICTKEIQDGEQTLRRSTWGQPEQEPVHLLMEL